MNLVVSAIGKGSLHNVWLNGNYDVMLIQYDESELTASKMDGNKLIYHKKQGSKFNLIAEFVPDNYDKYLFIDDDCFITSEAIEKLFEYEGIFSPSFFSDNINFPIMLTNEHTKFRETNWVELICLGMDNQRFNELKETFTLNYTGWGLPNLWHSKGYTFTIVDEVRAIHTRKQGTLYDNIGGIDNAYKEMIPFDNYEIRNLGIELNKPLLSVFIITRSEDEAYLKELYESIPDWCEIVTLITKVGDKWERSECIQKGNKKLAIMECKPEIKNYIRFDAMKNEAKNLCSGVFCLNLDTDERLIPYQLEQLYKKLILELNSDLDLFEVEIHNEGLGATHNAIRLFRNLQTINYTGFAHETIELSAKNLKREKLSLGIFHRGYAESQEVMQSKLERNLFLMLKDTKYNHLSYYLDKIHSTIQEIKKCQQKQA